MPGHEEGKGRQVRASLGFREFQLPPVGDGLLIGRRASIGPKALFESMERLLPGVYEMVPVEHGTIEAAIILKARLRMLGKDRLVAALVDAGATLIDDTSCLQLTIDGQVSFDVELD